MPMASPTVSSPGRLVAAPRFNRNSTIRRPRSACLGSSTVQHGTNGRGQRRPLEFDVPGVDVGAGVQKECRHGSVSVLGAGVEKRLAEPVRSVRIQSARQQPADQGGRPRISHAAVAFHALHDGWVRVNIEIEQFRVALPYHIAEKLIVADHLMTIANGLLHLLHAHSVRWRVGPVPLARVAAAASPGRRGKSLPIVRQHPFESEPAFGLAPCSSSNVARPPGDCAQHASKSARPSGAESSGVFGSAPCSSSRRTMCRWPSRAA